MVLGSVTMSPTSEHGKSMLNKPHITVAPSTLARKPASAPDISSSQSGRVIHWKSRATPPKGNGLIFSGRPMKAHSEPDRLAIVPQPDNHGKMSKLGNNNRMSHAPYFQELVASTENE